MDSARAIALAMLLAATLSTPGVARAQITPLRPYHGINRAITCTVRSPAEVHAPNEAELRLIDPISGAVIDRAPLPIPDEPTDTRTIDIGAAFPVIWTGRRPRLHYVQLHVDDQPTGPPLVLQPLLSPNVYRDKLTALVMDAFARKDAAELTRLLTLSENAKNDLRNTVSQPANEQPGIYSGIRAYTLRDVVLETSEGPIRISLEPAAAPNTVHRFLQLVDGGFYDDTAFHRVIAADHDGLPFLVQAGDPTGTGLGGFGTLADFERSPMRHDRATVSMARRNDDPNTNGSQFFICLSREACAKLDTRYTAFGNVTTGFDALEAIAATPLAPPSEGEPDAIAQTPIHPPMLIRATTTDAPPFQARSPSSDPLDDQSVPR